MVLTFVSLYAHRYRVGISGRLSLILLVLFSPSLPAFCLIKDDLGQAISLSLPAKRIISLAPDITEDLFAIGAGNRVVGVMKGSDYPEAAKKLTEVGSYSGLDLERIVLLHPDLIVTWGPTFARQLAALKKMGIPIYTTQPRQLDDIPLTLKRLGCLTGEAKGAAVAVQHYNQRLKKLRQAYQTQKIQTVFYQIGSYSLFTINKTSWINQAITLCGGRNVFAEARFPAPEISWEAVIAANPDIIISDVPGDQWKEKWQTWSQLRAVKHQALFSVNADTISRASPRLLEGVEQICQGISRVRTSRSVS